MEIKTVYVCGTPCFAFSCWNVIRLACCPNLLQKRFFISSGSLAPRYLPSHSLSNACWYKRGVFSNPFIQVFLDCNLCPAMCLSSLERNSLGLLCDCATIQPLRGAVPTLQTLFPTFRKPLNLLCALGIGTWDDSWYQLRAVCSCTWCLPTGKDAR